MISQTPKGGFYLGKEGGILNAIIGSLYLAGGGTLLALLFSLPIALGLNVYIQRNSKWAIVVRSALDVLWGIPSIVYGAFGFTIMLAMGMRASLLAGIVTLALVELPIMIRSMDEVLRLMPRDLEHASYGLGATKIETAIAGNFATDDAGINYGCHAGIWTRHRGCSFSIVHSRLY